MAKRVIVQPAEYDLKLRLKLGVKRFLKGLGASLLVAGVQYAAEFLQNSKDLFPQEYTLYVGLVVSALLGIEKAVQRQK
ncbi:hypothetical protein DRJ17_00790 [Candidatus Woesearchaeota archaeon]|nr:MAG: hypothetical protein DRJ17_00790 [Candidatus Woesearchaeota archaeon]